MSQILFFARGSTSVFPTAVLIGSSHGSEYGKAFLARGLFHKLCIATVMHKTWVSQQPGGLKKPSP